MVTLTSEFPAWGCNSSVHVSVSPTRLSDLQSWGWEAPVCRAHGLDQLGAQLMCMKKEGKQEEKKEERKGGRKEVEERKEGANLKNSVNI